MKLHARTNFDALRFAFAAAAICLLSSVASAFADLQESFTTDPGSLALGQTQAISLQGFDSSLGTLLSVTIEFDSSLSASIKVTNYGTSTESFQGASVTLPVTLTLNNAVSAFSLSSAPSSTVNSGSVGGTPAQQPPWTSATFTGSSLVSSTATNVSSQNLAVFESSGVINDLFSFGSSSLFNASQQQAGLDLQFGAAGTVDPTVKITYDYLVPEPSTWISLIAAVGAVLYIGRRSRKSVKA